VCRSERCSALIDWALPEPGRAQVAHPVDRASADFPGGNLEVWRDGRGQLRYRVMKKDEEPAPGRHRGVSHFATCVDADFYRKARTT
jgi:hypothetical protein